MAESFVNEQSGETFGPADYLGRLHTLERSIQRYDVAISNLKGDLTAAKKAKEKTVAELRDLVREVKMRAGGPGSAPRRRRGASGQKVES